ncbi:AAA family ATPase [Cytobacillus firmus]|nr:AAA family ATPase [Cytobacillus firmus]
MLLEAKLLSKVLIDKEFFVLAKYNIQPDDFSAYRSVYEYIKDFTREYGQTPDYRDVVAKFPKFEMQIEVFDTFAYLCKALKKARVKKRIFDVLTTQAGVKYKESEIDAFIEWMGEEISTAKNVLKSSTGLGTNYANNGDERKKRYEETKEKGSGLFIETPYESLTRYLDGGFELGDYVLLQAFSNVGKSWIASHIGTHAWLKGHQVIHYSPELSKAQQENRNDTLIGHFNNVAIRNGELKNEEKYFKYLENFKDNDTGYIIKTMEDIDKLDVDLIEADLQMNPETKMVIIDGFNLMSHGKGDRTGMTQTSRRLRQLFARYGVVGIVVHQVNASEQKENSKKNDNAESPVPRPASMFGYSETIAVIQDACTVLSYDAVDGNGAIFIAKCRGTGKEKQVDLNVNYNMGFIEEGSPVNYF